MVQVLQDERWVEISDFPTYSVSDWGRVLNSKTGLCITPTTKPQGLRMVGLMKDGVQNKRSLPLLVARAFLPIPTNESFDTPIHLDGDRSNSYFQNLEWRPLWFSRKYMRQFDDNHTTYDAPIEDVETGELYKNSMHAAVTHGLLDNEIYLSMLNNHYVWPTGQVFRQAIDR